MLKHFQQTLEPTIKKSLFKTMDDTLKPFFDETYVKHYDCKECEEHCQPEIFTRNGDLCINCDNDVLQSPYVISNDDTLRYKFSIEKFVHAIAKKNNIKGKSDKRDDETFYIGTKNVSDTDYDVFYIRNFANNDKHFIAEKRHKFQELKINNHRMIVITPDEIITNKTTEDLLKTIPCEIIRLDKLLEKGLLIDSLISFVGEDLEHLKNTYDLLIISAKEIWFMKNKVSLTPQAFRLLNFLARTPNVTFNREDCIKSVWGEEYAEGNKTLSNNISAIRKVLNNTQYIQVRNKTVMFEFDTNMIYIR